jgi:hypothetical protein
MIAADRGQSALRRNGTGFRLSMGASCGGKWSPGQVTEHVALAYEQSRRMLSDLHRASSAGSQLLARWIFLRLMFKRGDLAKPPWP